VKKFISSLATVALMGAGLIAVGALASPASATQDVTFCHDTDGPHQVEITTSWEGWENGHKKHIGTNVQGHDNDRLGPCPTPPKPPVVAPVAPEVVGSTKCEVNGSVTPATTEGVVYVVGGTSPTAITVTATPAKGFRFEGESQQVVYGPYNVGADKCPPTPTPTPTPDPTTPAPPAGPPAPPTDFCPNLEGVQWENYDCNTGVVPPVVPTPEATPTVEPTPTPEVTKPPVVSIPDEPVIPEAVPAGDGSSQDSFPWVPMILIAAAAGILGSVLRMRYSRK